MELKLHSSIVTKGTPVTLALPDQPVTDLLCLLTSKGGFDLRFQIDHHQAGHTPELTVEFSGPDTTMLTTRQGELLYALEHIAAKVLRLEPEEHDRISFDASGFKLLRDHELQAIAEQAVARVRSTGLPYTFPIMNSRERRTLHLALKSSGLTSASSGEGPRRFVVLYPEGEGPAAAPSHEDRAEIIRSRFRRR